MWLYHHVPGLAYEIRSLLRRPLRRLPPDAGRAVAFLFAAQAAAFDRTLTFNEHRVAQLDFFTPRYRWEHTPHEIEGWCHELGLRPETRSITRDGFGVLAHS